MTYATAARDAAPLITSMVHNITMVALYSGAHDLSGDDVVTLANVTIKSPGIGVSLRERLADIVRRIHAKHGSAAFSSTKEAAAVHEAGHTVMYTVLGLRPKLTRIEPMQGQWVGVTQPRNNKRFDMTSADDMLKMARSLYAGLAAEMCARQSRPGSSLDELLMSQLLAANAVAGTGRDPEEYWGNEVHKYVVASLVRHQHVVEELAGDLYENGEIRGPKMREYVERVERRGHL